MSIPGGLGVRRATTSATITGWCRYSSGANMPLLTGSVDHGTLGADGPQPLDRHAVGISPRSSEVEAGGEGDFHPASRRAAHGPHRTEDMDNGGLVAGDGTQAPHGAGAAGAVAVKAGVVG